MRRLTLDKFVCSKEKLEFLENKKRKKNEIFPFFIFVENFHYQNVIYSAVYLYSQITRTQIFFSFVW